MLQQSSSQDSTALQEFLETSNSFYQDLLGYKPEQTSLREIPREKWEDLTQQFNLSPNSSGIYLPRNQTAIIQEDDALGLFHEYSGHGLYCEDSIAGIHLVELEKKLLGEEEQEFDGRSFTLEDLQKFRTQNQTFQELDEFRKQNLAKYETFAIWTEYLLSREFGLNDDFEERYNSLPPEDQESINSAIRFSNQFGDLATHYAFGLRKIQDQKRLLKLSQGVFGRKLNRTQLILHFGSGKPFSDVDLFVVSNDIPSTYDPWLDVRAYQPQDLDRGIRVLNPMITDPIMTGTPIFGDERYLKELRGKTLAQPITEEAIRFNLREYEKDKRASKDKCLGEHLQEKNLRSSKTYLTNTLALRRGHKILTFNELVEYSHVLSHGGKFIELKGGIE